jgi:hypothetical protein
MVKRERQRVVIVGGVLNGLVAGVSHGSDHVASSFLRRHSNLAQLPLPSHHKMSVSLNPSSALGFRSAYLPFLVLVVAHRVPQDH